MAARVVGTPSAWFASDARYSRRLERSTLRPSAVREYGVPGGQGRRKPQAAGEGRGGRARRRPQGTDCCGCAPGYREALKAHAAFRRAAGAWLLGRRGGARFPPGWRAASALELHLPPLASRREQLAQVHGRAVAQLARKVAELVAAVAVRRRLRSGQQLVATEEGREVRPLHLVGADAEQREHVRRGRYQPRPLERRRSCQAEARARHPAWCRSVLRVGIYWQRTQLQVVKGELLQRACRTAVDVHRVCVGLHRGGSPARSGRLSRRLGVNRWKRAQKLDLSEDMHLYVSCTVQSTSRDLRVKSKQSVISLIINGQNGFCGFSGPHQLAPVR